MRVASTWKRFRVKKNSSKLGTYTKCNRNNTKSEKQTVLIVNKQLLQQGLKIKKLCRHCLYCVACCTYQIRLPIETKAILILLLLRIVEAKIVKHRSSLLCLRFRVHRTYTTNILFWLNISMIRYKFGRPSVSYNYTGCGVFSASFRRTCLLKLVK